MCTVGYTNHRDTTYQKQRDTYNGSLWGTALGTNTTLVVTLLSDTNCVASVKALLLVRP